jgi:hypothetical protein
VTSFKDLDFLYQALKGAHLDELSIRLLPETSLISKQQGKLKENGV